MTLGLQRSNNSSAPFNTSDSEPSTSILIKLGSGFRHTKSSRLVHWTVTACPRPSDTCPLPSLLRRRFKMRYTARRQDRQSHNLDSWCKSIQLGVMSQRFGIFFVRFEREDPRSQTRRQRNIETESRTHVVEHSSAHQSVHQNLLNSQLVIPFPRVHFPARIYLKYQPYSGPPAHPQALFFREDSSDQSSACAPVDTGKVFSLTR